MGHEPTIQFINSMVSYFPNLSPLLEDHIQDYEGILPHVFLGDFTRYVVALFYEANKGDLSSQQELRNILDFLEQAYASNNPEVQELISVSFLENLPWQNEMGA